MTPNVGALYMNSQHLRLKCNFIAQGSFYTHSDPIFKKFNLLKVNDIHLHQQLKLYFKLINNILPDHSYDFYLALNSDNHD